MSTEDMGSVIVTAVAMFVLLMPVLRYIVVGWSAKRADIMDGMSKSAMFKYFVMFNKVDVPANDDEAEKRMQQMYSRWYGRRLYAMPIALLLLVGVLGIHVAVASILCPEQLDRFNCAQFRMDFTGIAAIAGAYMWVLNDFIWRARRQDFAPSDIAWGVLRLTIAIPMGYAFAAIASKDAGPFVAFAIGAFPLDALTTVLQRTALDKVGYKERETEISDGVTKLQGVNNDIVDRLAKEDITTITQVAYCDPIRLTMRSSLTFNLVTDLMNQALAWEYLDGGMDKIRPFGLRGAVEIAHFVSDLKSGDDSAAGRQARDAMKAVVAVLESSQAQTDATLRNAFDEIVGDPFTDYLVSIWE